MVPPSVRDDWALKAWSSPALLALLLGRIRVVPTSGAMTPSPPLAGRLRPFRRRLWRRRALLLLLRGGMLALGCLLAANLAALLWWPDLSPGVRALPALLVLLCGCWLIVAQWPTLHETARLLDRRFQLRDQLGTAIEISAGAESGALAARQLARATAALDALPPNAWATPRLPGLERLIGLALAAGVVLSAFASPMRHPSPAALSASGPAAQHAHQAGRTRQAAQREFTLRSGPAASSRRTLPARARALPVGHMTAFAASFQARPEAQAAGSGGPLAVSSAPAEPLAVPPGDQRSGTGTGTGAQSGSVSGAASRAAQPGRAGGGGAGLGGQQSGQGTGQQSGGGTQQGTGSAQAGQSGQGATTLGAPEPGADAGSPSGAAAGHNSRGKAGQQPAGSQDTQNGSGAPSGANPFGQDGPPARAGTHGATARGNGAGQQTRTGSGASRGTGAGSQATGTTRQNGANGQPGDPEQELARRRGATTGAQASQPGPATRTASGATGPEIDIGGQVQIGGNGSGSQGMRIEPLIASPAPAPAGTLPSGSGVVRGYVPRDDSTLSPGDQGVIRAYFSQGSGS